MSTYFSGSNTQRDAATMLYLKEPLPSSYSEAPVLPGNMMLYMNYASSSGSYSDTLAGNSQQPNSCTDIASVTATNANPSQQEILSDPGGSRIGLHDFSAWKNGGNEMLLMQPARNAADVVLQGAQTLQGQALSLSLGTHVTPGFQMSSIQYRNPQLGFSSFMGPNQLISGEGSGRNGSFGDNDDSQSKQTGNSEYMHPGFPGNNSDARTDISSYGMSSIARTISNSKYLKAAQQLLDEVVNVRTALKERNSKKELTKDPKELDGGSKDGSSDPSATGTTANPQDSSNNELSAAEKQELQNKLSKLLSMLDEVDHRYKQYCHQMQIVVSSFDMVAGSGAAKSYTELALQTISRHFRSLRDAINGQIQATRKSLGEQDASANSKGISISRLRYVDQQLRQQRALQQLGMMQQHAWRPQRGLPENAVSILRAWLFEHFLHPYPKDSDKIMLARQTGLTRSQVSNWFINARVRLWKPMVEEMYKEEIGDAEMDSTSSAEVVPKATKSDTKVSEDRGGEDAHQTATSTAMEHRMTGKFFDSKFNHKSDAEMCKSITNAAFQNVSHAGTQNSYEEQRPVVDENTIFTDIVGHSHGSSDRFMAAATAAYHMSELERFGNGSGVSLTLGLQHREGGSLPMSVEARHGFGTLRADDVYDTTPSSIGPETTDFDCIDPGNRQHKFGSSNVLHDFVA